MHITGDNYLTSLRRQMGKSSLATETGPCEATFMGRTGKKCQVTCESLLNCTMNWHIMVLQSIIWQYEGHDTLARPAQIGI